VSLPTVPKTKLLIDFLRAIGWDDTEETGYVLSPGPEIIESPDKLITLTPTTGPGFITEEAGLDAWGFQSRLRGPSDDSLSPELAAQQLDVMILNASYPLNVDGVNIQLVYRPGSPPIAMPLDPSDRRTDFTCTYMIISQTGA